MIRVGYPSVLAGGATPSTAVAAADLNGSGVANDLVFARQGAPNAIYHFQGGSYGAPVEFGPPAADTTALVIGDVDGDLDEDIVTGHVPTGRIGIK